MQLLNPSLMAEEGLMTLEGKGKDGAVTKGYIWGFGKSPPYSTATLP